MSYTTQTKVENLTGLTLTASQAAALVDIIAAIKVWMDKYCGKTFEGASETRYYDGCGEKKILVDSFTGTPTVLILNINGTTAATLTEGQANDFITSPYNSTEKNMIELTGLGSYSQFPVGSKRLKVTATFGATTTVPADVQFAATRLAGAMLQDGGEGIVKSVRLGDYAATYATIDEKAEALGIQNTLDGYRDIDL